MVLRNPIPESLSQGETGRPLRLNIQFTLLSPGRVLNVWNANTVPHTGDHPVIPFSGRNSTMTAVDILSTLLDSLGITLAQLRILLGI